VASPLLVHWSSVRTLDSSRVALWHLGLSFGQFLSAGRSRLRVVDTSLGRALLLLAFGSHKPSAASVKAPRALPRLRCGGSGTLPHNRSFKPKPLRGSA